MEQLACFRDRAEAGKKLAEELAYLKENRLIVLAVLNGGLPVGQEISQALECPLSYVSAHKLYLPNHPELGFGALSHDGFVRLNQEAIEGLGLARPEIEKIIEDTLVALKQKTGVLSAAKIIISPIFKTVILVDDGLASGYTMLAAIQAAKKQSPKRIIIALPTASAQGLELVKKEVDKVVCLYIHPQQYPFKIAASYQNWQSVGDEEVLSILTHQTKLHFY